MATRPVQVPGQSADPAAQDAPAPQVDQAPAADKPKAAKAHKPAEPEGSDGRHLRAHEVDPSRIKRAVLTADGWVCPAKSPAPPAKE